MTMTTIGFIGGGKMAEAIAGALTDRQPPFRVIVSDVSPERRALLAQVGGVQVTANNREVLATARIVFLAVKPQQLDEVLAELAPAATAEHLFISIAAGKRLGYFEARLPAGRIARVMPNLAALVGASVNAFCLGGRCAAADRDLVVGLLETFGVACELPEDLFDAVTALSGSGPAFVAYFVNALSAGGRALGLAPQAADTLARQTVLGTARLLASGRYTPDALIQAVSSARGTTVAGMDVLTRTALVEDVRRTLAAAAARSRELSQPTDTRERGG